MAIDIEVTIFAGHWRDKVVSHTESTIENLMDRYISLYIAYNALYHQIAVQEKNESNYKDNLAATKYVIEYLLSEQYIDNILSDDDGKNSIKEFINILNGEEFCIFIEKDGRRNKKKDHSLAIKLTSSNKAEMAHAVVTFLYKVRCNIIHGSKSLDNRQKIVLLPANAILLKTVNQIIQTIENRNL